MAAWFCTFGAAARENGASAHAPGDALMCPHTVSPTRPPGTRTRCTSAHRSRGRPPDAPEAGHDVEGVVLPWQGMHVPDPQVCVGVAVPSHGDQARRRIDTRAPGAAQAGELNGEAGSAGDVQQRVACAHAQPVVQGDVLPTVGRFAESGELHRPPAPALVDAAPARRRAGSRPTGSPVTVVTSGGPDRGSPAARTARVGRGRRRDPSASLPPVRRGRVSGNLRRSDSRATWPSMRASGAPRQ